MRCPLRSNPLEDGEFSSHRLLTGFGSRVSRPICVCSARSRGCYRLCDRSGQCRPGGGGGGRPSSASGARSALEPFSSHLETSRELLSMVLVRRLAPPSVVRRPPSAEGICAPRHALADAPTCLARGHGWQSCWRRMRSPRLGSPRRLGCWPDVAGGRLWVAASTLGARQVPTGRAGARCALVVVRQPRSRLKAALVRSSERHRDLTAMY